MSDDSLYHQPALCITLKSLLHSVCCQLELDCAAVENSCDNEQRSAKEHEMRPISVVVNALGV